MRGLAALLHGLLLALFLAGAVAAQDVDEVLPTEDVVLGLSHNRVQISTNFDGSKILIFGAVKRTTPMPESELDVIIAIAGPSEPIVVRRKERRLGIWVNTDAEEIPAAPSFYAVASSRPLAQVLTANADLLYRISAPKSVWALQSQTDFAEAVLRIRSEEGLYQLNENSVEVTDQTLFRTSITMPANLTEGAYITRVFLVRDEQIVSFRQTVIDVRKVGMERFLFNLSRQQPLIYGFLSLFIAITAGWGASAAFRVMRRG